MFFVTYPNSKKSKVCAQAGRKHEARGVRVPKIGAGLRKALAAFGGICVNVFNAIAEARVQKAMIEAELYRKRYLHSSKNDDDLPIAEPMSAACGDIYEGYRE